MADVPKTVEILRLRFGIDAAFPAPEGGWFLPTGVAERGRYEPPATDPRPDEPGTPSDIASTVPASSGYYVLVEGGLGALHVLKGVEIYAFVEGDPVEICRIDPGGHADVICLGPPGADGPAHAVVEGRVAHGLLSLRGEAEYSLLHLVAVPAFDPADASVPTRSELVARFPKQKELIQRFTAGE